MAGRRLLPPAATLGLLLWALTRPWGPVPPIGPLLDPYHGIWGVARSASRPAYRRASVPGLVDSVVVIYDDRAVPHIFAGSVLDAQRALGYVVARDRLLQLQLQTRATAGRLTEWVGPVALDLDRAARRLFLAGSAELEYARLQASDPAAIRSFEAFADGVNARIDGLDRGDWPLEYHLLGVPPDHWQPVHTLYLLKQMSYTLSFSSHDLRYRRLVPLIGPDAARALLGRDSPLQEPVIPDGEHGPRFDFVRLPPPEPIPSGTATGEPTGGTTDPAWPARDGWSEPIYGSNDWAVGPGRSADGAALLAGDPHLDLSLPAIWYEVHEVIPGSLDVYGATLPGTPSVVVGFNRNVAWSFTNNAADVVDFYREEVDDPADPTMTMIDGEWHPVERTVSSYRDRAGSVVATDTIYRSSRGPLIRDGDDWLSLRWVALEPSTTTRALAGVVRAADVSQWMKATELFDSPSQNGLVADRRGDIAIRSLGRVPIRPPVSYPFVWDGTTSASDWRGYQPTERLPFSRNPAQGFLASANQQPVDPATDTTYWGRNWPTPWRAMRINEVLRNDTAVTADEMRRLQTDSVGPRARYFLPYLEAAGRGPAADDDARTAAELLAEWDGAYSLSNERAVLFEAVMVELQERLWDELRDEQGRFIFFPRDGWLASMMTDPASIWWDDRSTPDRERRDDILAASLAAGLGGTRARHGEPAGGGWRWDRVRRFTIPHLLRLPGLGARRVANSGGPNTLSPMGMRGSHGASWRMVVELGDSVRGWTIYPGGQAGNPASPHYRDRVATWSAGELEEVRFPRRAEDLPAAARRTRLVLTPSDR